MKLRKILVPVIVAGLAIIFVQSRDFSSSSTSITNPPSDIQLPSAESPDDLLQNAYHNKLSNQKVQGQGIVSTLLSDDLKGSRHQRFILMLDSGQTLLIAHNIDLAPKIPNLKTGDTVEFNGEYEWNADGGVIHWTHHDPNRQHRGGWLKHNGKLYE